MTDQDSGAVSTDGTATVRRPGSAPLFFVLAFVLTWPVWVLVAVAGGEPSVLHHVAVGVAATGPSLAGLFCTGRDEGLRGVHCLLRSLLHWRLRPRWYAVALCGPISIALVAVSAHRLLFGDAARFHLASTTLFLVPPALVAGMFIGSLQEELGWRGYALRRLLERHMPVRAALSVGAAWAVWHVPLYGIVNGGQERSPLGVFMISVVALSVVHTWLWVVTGGSVLMAFLLHSGTNVAGVLLLKDAQSDFGPVTVATVLTVALAVVAAVRLQEGKRFGEQ